MSTWYPKTSKKIKDAIKELNQFDELLDQKSISPYEYQLCLAHMHKTLALLERTYILEDRDTYTIRRPVK